MASKAIRASVTMSATATGDVKGRVSGFDARQGQQLGHQTVETPSSWWITVRQRCFSTGSWTRSSRRVSMKRRIEVKGVRSSSTPRRETRSAPPLGWPATDQDRPKDVASQSCPAEARTKIRPPRPLTSIRRCQDHDPITVMNTVGIRAVSMKTMRARCRKMMVGDRIFTSPFVRPLALVTNQQRLGHICVSAERQRADLRTSARQDVTMS